MPNPDYDAILEAAFAEVEENASLLPDPEIREIYALMRAISIVAVLQEEQEQEKEML